ncbi:MAG: IS3 family transposase [Candidatus Bipolaricaulia bacterium]
MRKLNQEEGYSVTDICDAFEVSRNSYYYHKAKAESNDQEDDDQKFSEFNQRVLEKIKEVKRNHPYYGYRRVTARVNAKLDVRVNRKRVYRLMKEAEDDLLCENPNYEATRHDKDDRDKPQPDEPNDWWGIDMTKHYIDGYGWQSVVAVKDWHTKEILGRSIATDGKTKRWKSALQEAVQYACPNGSREEDINLMSDNGTQPTSYAFEKLCSDLGINHVTTSYDNPKGNAETESWMRTLKEDCLWINDFDSPKEAKEKISSWIEYYNTEYPHSTIGMKSPRDIREESELVEEVEESINSSVKQMAVKSV